MKTYTNVFRDFQSDANEKNLGGVFFKVCKGEINGHVFIRIKHIKYLG